MIPLAFQGGTALRFLYSIRRYSEDLDFALERPDRGYDFRAYLQRSYPKGRDIYDLIWYLSDRTWPSPNLVLLNSALQQTGWGEPLAEATWRSRVADKVRELNWDRVVQDVVPFLEDAQEIELVARENVLALF